MLYAFLTLWASPLYAQTKSVSVERNLTVTKGVILNIDPLTDTQITLDYLSGANTSYTLSDNSAFTVSRQKVSNANGKSYYYKMKLTPSKAGSYTLTIPINGYVNDWYYKYTIRYDITVIDLYKINIPNKLVLNVDESYTIIPSLSPSDAQNSLTWTSLNPNVATVANGVVTAVNAGDAMIICQSDNGVSAQCDVTVRPILVTQMELNAEYLDLIIGETILLEPIVSPSNATNKSVTWNSSDTSVANVDGNGLVTAVSPGHCSITAQTADGSNQSASCQVTVISDVLFINDAIGVPSGMLVLPLQLQNASSITGLQFELQLPNEVSVVTSSTGKLLASLSDRASDQIISGSLLSNGNYQFVVFSATSSPMYGNEGAIAYVTLNIEEDLAVGEYEVNIKEIELTTTDGKSLHHKDLTSKLTLTEAISGDINGDSRVTVTDAVGIVNYVLHRPPSVFITKAADVNGDGNITVSDAVNVINIVLNK